MLRITHGHSVQHIPFPFPVLRDLDEEPAPEDAAYGEAPAPVTAKEDAAETDAPTDAPQ